MKIRELLSNPSRWIRYYNAKNNKGEIVQAENPSACRYCLIGAIAKCYGGLSSKKFDKIYNKIYKNIPDKYITVTQFNDSSDFATVKALVDKLDI